jgi:hypothetical protein
VSNTVKLKRQSKPPVRCPRCQMVFESVSAFNLHIKQVQGGTICLHPAHDAVRMYYSRGRWRVPKDN